MSAVQVVDALQRAENGEYVVGPWTPRSTARSELLYGTGAQEGVDGAHTEVEFPLAHVKRSERSDDESALLMWNECAQDAKRFKSLLRGSKIYFDSYARDVVLQQALEVGMRQTRNPEDADILWFEAEPPSWQILNATTPHQRINCFSGMKQLATKCEFARVVNLVKEMVRGTHQETILKFVPNTWSLPEDRDALLAWQKETQQTNPRYSSSRSSPSRPAKVFVVKPDAGCGGDGIYLTTNAADIRHSACVVQEYITSPLLLGGLKFDLRLYVVVTSVQPLRFHIQKEGLARMAVEPYDPNPQHLHRLNMHLTNYSLNKFSSKFVENTDARDDSQSTKRSISTAFAQLKKAYGSDWFEEDTVWDRIASLVDTTLTVLIPFLTLAVKDRHYLLSRCFQIMGFDILLDANCEPHLLEVNHHPSLLTDAPIDWLVKGMLLRHTLRMVGHEICVRKQRRKLSRKDACAAKDREDPAVNAISEGANLFVVPRSAQEWEFSVSGPAVLSRISELVGTPIHHRYVATVNALRDVFLVHADDARSKNVGHCTLSALKFAKFCRRAQLIPGVCSTAEADLMYLRAPKSRTDGLSFSDFIHLCLGALGGLLAPETSERSPERLEAVVARLSVLHE